LWGSGKSRRKISGGLFVGGSLGRVPPLLNYSWGSGGEENRGFFLIKVGGLPFEQVGESRGHGDLLGILGVFLGISLVVSLAKKGGSNY